MNQLTVSCSPHFSSKTKTQNIMLDVIIALAPLVVCSALFFGYQAIITLVITVAACVAGEYIYNVIASKFKDFRPGTVKDLSAVVTGLILGLNLPSNIDWYMPILGGLFAIMIVKMLFGGIGRNIVNPALAGRIFLFISFAAAMNIFTNADALQNGFNATVNTGATALGGINDSLAAGTSYWNTTGAVSLLDMFLGKMSGVMGETSVLAILIGYGYLVVRKVIDWKGPIIYIASSALFLLIFGWLKAGGTDPFMTSIDNLLPALMSGGLVFGAVFMATDYATSPNTLVGNIIYFAGCGFMTAVFRIFTEMNEGASFAILFMNCLVPLIDKYIVPKPFGYVKPVKPAKEAK